MLFKLHRSLLAIWLTIHLLLHTANADLLAPPLTHPLPTYSTTVNALLGPEFTKHRSTTQTCVVSMVCTDSGQLSPSSARIPTQPLTYAAEEFCRDEPGGGVAGERSEGGGG